MMKYRGFVLLLPLALWGRALCQDGQKTGYIPRFLCDYERPQLEQQTSCIVDILPRNLTDLLAEKLAKILKGRDMYDFLQEVCKKTPRMILHGKRGLLQAVPKPDRPLLSITFDACTNATLYFMPLISKTKYEDLD